MATSSKSVRKSILFDGSDRDQALLDAVKAELAGNSRYRSFADLCKAALHQFLLSREPTQSVILFMELERQIAAMQSQIERLESAGSPATLERLEVLESQIASVGLSAQKPAEDMPAPDAKPQAVDPLLARLGPLLESF